MVPCRGLWEEVVTKHSMASKALRVAAASGIALAVLAPSAAAFAADYPSGTTNTPSDPGSTVAGNTATNNSSTLPFTGSDVAGMVVIGAGAALAGVVMVRHSKKSRVTA
jgi:hypothetical protein